MYDVCVHDKFRSVCGVCCLLQPSVPVLHVRALAHRTACLLTRTDSMLFPPKPLHLEKYTPSGGKIQYGTLCICVIAVKVPTCLG